MKPPTAASRVLALFGVLALTPVARAGAGPPRTYLAVAGGTDVLLTNVQGEVVSQRVVGHIELGLGSHLNDHWLLEASFGRQGTQQMDGPIRPLLSFEELLLSDAERTYRVEVNPMMLRLRYARSGFRSGYIKPEFSVGAGVLSVTRWMRPPPGIPPASTSDLIPALELGATAMMVMNKNWMGYLGPRWVWTTRRTLTAETDHLDGLAILLGFRFFLNSPRDEFEDP